MCNRITAFVLKHIEDNGKNYQLILRLKTSQDPKEYKNSIITFLKVEEIGTFQDVLDKAQKQIQSAGDSIDKLIGTRTRAINRKLTNIGTMDDADKAQKLLGIDSDTDI